MCIQRYITYIREILISSCFEMGTRRNVDIAAQILSSQIKKINVYKIHMKLMTSLGFIYTQIRLKNAKFIHRNAFSIQEIIV